MSYEGGYSLPAINHPISLVVSVASKAKAALGERIVYGGEEYVFAHNAGNSEAGPGYGVVLSAVSGASFTVSSTTMVDPPYGVVKHATFPTGGYGWLLTRGYVNVENGMASTALAAADNICLGADGGWVKAVQSGATAGVLTQPVLPYGKMMAATGSAGSATAYVKCWG